MTRSMCIGLVSAAFAAGGCNSEPAKADRGEGELDSGAGGADAGPTKPAVRSACGDMPILDDRWRDTSDECKACVETECCGEAEACAGNADCKSLWECRATCDARVSTCFDSCNATLQEIPAEDAALTICRNACPTCLDVASCRQSEWAAPPETSYPITFVCVSYTAGAVVFPGLTVKVCEPADVECTNPLSQGITADDGTVTVDLPSGPGFTDTYLEITGPNVQPTRSYLRSSPALARGLIERGTSTQRLLDSATASALAGVLGAKADRATTA